MIRALRGLGRAYRYAVVWGRWLLLLAWIGAAAVTSFLLPTPHGGGDDIGGLLPPGSASVAVEQRILEQFQVPVISQTTVVIHDPAGLSSFTRSDAFLFAWSYTQAYLNGTAPTARDHIVAAIPIPTSRPDTIATHLYMSEGTSLARTAALAHQYAAHFHGQGTVQTYVTGIAPAQAAQADYLNSRLHFFEVATLLLIAVVVGITFRSVVAPVVVLVAAGLGYLVALRVLGLLAARLGFALPDQLEPLIAALLIGVVTDYCVLFFSGLRQQLDRGLPRLAAARATVSTDGPIVAVAGITVAGGTAALLAANFQLFRAFGPALSLTVVVGMLASLTLVPALLAILGPRLFWPGSLFWPDRTVARPTAERRAGRLIRVLVTRRGAAAAGTVSVAVLLLAAAPALHLRLGLSFTSVLPWDDPVRRGAAVLADAGIRGVVSPTEVLVEAPGIARQRDALARLQTAIAAQPGVADVIGPAQNQFLQPLGIVLAQDGHAARYIVVFDSDPLAAPAIDDLNRLAGRLPALTRQAGLPDASVAVAGETAIAGELTALTRENLRITLLAVLGVEFLILVLFLRSLLTPLLLLICSALGVAAALGLTVLVFQDWLGDPSLTFYAPFASAVLLLALGSDYNVFAVGSIWEVAARLPLSKAIARAMPSTARAIRTAGVILAATFAMVALIPLETFRQMAFTLAVGLLIDTFLIRPVLTPVVLTLLGRVAGWPGRRISTRSVPAEEIRRTAAAGAATAGVHVSDDVTPAVEAGAEAGAEQ